MTVRIVRRRSRWLAIAAATSALAALAACVGPRSLPAAATLPPPAPPRAAVEDEHRFGASAVDMALPDYDALGYEIDLRVADVPGRETFAADVKGSYVATRDLAELTLDFDGNTIDGVLIGGRPAQYRRVGAKLVVALPHAVARGDSFTSRIRYHAALVQADGAEVNDFAAFGALYVKQRNAERKRIYTSLGWPSKTRRWLPVRDHPSDGAMVAMNLTFPRSFTVLANGENVGRTENGDGTSTWRYQSLAPMPVYDFHLAAYEGWKVDAARSPSGVPIATYTYARAEKKQPAVYGDLPKALDFYETRFGRYRWGTARFVEEPIFGGAMEHTTVVSMDETLFRDPPEARKVAFHELAHHWSGNLVRIRTWNDFWLSEGFADYLTARFVAENDGPAARKAMLRAYLTQALAADRGVVAHAVRPPDPEIDVLTIFDAISYQKGALVLHALEREVGGEDALTRFLKTWFERHAFGAVVTADFEAELSAAAGKDLSRFFAGFVYGDYHPEVRVTFASAGGAAGAGSAASGDVDLDIVVEQLQTRGPAEGFAFTLDVDLVDATGRKERFAVDVDRRTTRKRVRTARPPVAVVVDPDEWLLGTVACGAPAASECNDGFRCATGAVSVCVPR